MFETHRTEAQITVWTQSSSKNIIFAPHNLVALKQIKLKYHQLGAMKVNEYIFLQCLNKIFLIKHCSSIISTFWISCRSLILWYKLEFAKIVNFSDLRCKLTIIIYVKLRKNIDEPVWWFNIDLSNDPFSIDDSPRKTALCLQATQLSN